MTRLSSSPIRQQHGLYENVSGPRSSTSNIISITESFQSNTFQTKIRNFIRTRWTIVILAHFIVLVLILWLFLIAIPYWYDFRCDDPLYSQFENLSSRNYPGRINIIKTLFRKFLFFIDTIRERPQNFIHPKITSHLKCERLLNNDTNYISQMRKERVDLVDSKCSNDFLKVDCNSIFSRNYFPQQPLTDFEKDFPIAHARIVYDVSDFF